jgi:hypothetical protein
MGEKGDAAHFIEKRAASPFILLRMPFEIAVGRDPNRDVDKSLHLPSVDTEAVVSRAAAAAALDHELAGTGTLPARRTELARSTASMARLRDSRLEVPGSLAFPATCAPDHTRTVTRETGLRRTLEAPAAPAAIAGAFVLPCTVTRPAFQSLRTRPFATKARAVVVDRADRILDDRAGAILIPPRSVAIVRPEQESEQSHVALLHVVLHCQMQEPSSLSFGGQGRFLRRGTTNLSSARRYSEL